MYLAFLLKVFFAFEIVFFLLFAKLVVPDCDSLAFALDLLLFGFPERFFFQGEVELFDSFRVREEVGLCDSFRVRGEVELCEELRE